MAPVSDDTVIDPFADVETTPLAIVDFSGFDTDPAARARISDEISKACSEIGFLVLVNHGLEGVEKEFEIAKELFALPYEEKEKFNMSAGASGNYFGYKRMGQQIINSKGEGDGCEYWNTAKASSLKNRRPNPEPVEKNLPTMHAFSKDCHDLVLKLLGIFSEQLGKERDFFAKRHRWEAEAGDMIRMIRYPPMPEDPERALMAGHTDFGSITLLFNQSVGGLQVLDRHDGKWKFVRPVPGGIIVNIGDAMQFWTGGALKSSMHRVITPPGVQKDQTRYSVVYFSRPEDTCELTPINGSVDPNEKVWTAGEWIKMRVVTSQASNFKGKDSWVAHGVGGAPIHVE